MIYLDSRYATGPLFTAGDSRSGGYNKTVFREWPSYNVQYFMYTVTENDRIEDLAVRYLGNPELWWEIMDINPEVLNPLEIPAGTQLRIPNE